MAKCKEKQTDVVQAVQSQPADAESKVKTDPNPGQSQPPENGAPGNAEQQSQPPEDEAPEDPEVQQNPEPEAEEQADLEIMQNQKANAEKPPTFVIICRNKINKMIGGVSFVDGIGYTSDGFTASWFGNKEGYEVNEVRNSGL